MQDSVMKVAGEILDRMAELKSFFNDVSKGPDDRQTYNHEFTELQKELNSLKSQNLTGFPYSQLVSLIVIRLKSLLLMMVWVSTSNSGVPDCLKISNPNMVQMEN